MSFAPVELTNGVRFTYVNTEKGKSDSLYAALRIPLSDESYTKISIISEILERGTQKFPDTRAISRECEDNYGTILHIVPRKTNNEVLLCFCVTFLRNEYAFDGEDIFTRAVKLLSETIFRPYLENGCFSSVYTEREKDSLYERISSLINNKRSYALYRARKVMCDGEPSAVFLYDHLDMIKSSDAVSLTDFYFKALSESPVEIIYAGTQKCEYVTEAVLRELPFSPRYSNINNDNIRKNVDEIKYVTEETSATQSTLVMGYRIAGDLEGDRYIDLNLFEAILSGSPASKLFMNVREKLSLCYYCNTVIDSKNGVMFIYAGIDEKNCERAKKAITKQINDIKNGKITQKELDNAIRMNYNVLRSETDDTAALCLFYLSRIIKNRFSTPEEEAESMLLRTASGAVDIAQGIVLDTVYLLKGIDG